MKALRQGAYFAVLGVIMLYFSFNMLLVRYFLNFGEHC